MPGRTKQSVPRTLEDLDSSVSRIFDQAQISSANHQKNFVALYKLHTEVAQFTETVNNGRGVKLTGEKKFEEIFTLFLTRILPLRKGIGPADRIIKFVGGYIRFVNEKAVEEKSLGDEGDEDEDEDTTASRFTARLLKFLLKGFLAKEKTVRYRVLYTVAEMVSHLGAIDEEIYTELRTALLDRVHDKEPAVRVQAMISLAKLAGSEDPSEVNDGESSVLDVLIDTLSYDPSPEVRRAALLNLPPIPVTIPHILARTRDTDVTIRKLVYSAVLGSNITLNEDTEKVMPNEIAAMGLEEDVKSDINIPDKGKISNRSKQTKAKYMGPTHPRALTIAQREVIVRNGLGDREPSVRAAAAGLVGAWADVVNVGIKDEESTDVKQEAEDVTQPVSSTGNAATDKGIAFLKLFDLENEIASDALLSVFASRTELYDGLEFNDSFWSSLTAERAFMARVFVNYCCSTKNTTRLEESLPVVTALAFRIQESYNSLVEHVKDLEENRVFTGSQDLAKDEDDKADREFIIAEILELAINLDYSDEIGRRKMFQLMRDMLSQETLPERLVPKCLDVLRELSASERDLIRVVVEIIQDLRDPLGDDDDDVVGQEAEMVNDYGATPATVRPTRVPLFKRKKPQDRTPEERAHADSIDLRCLSLCVGVLERVNSKLEDNSTLSGVLMDLIFPSVQREEPYFQEKGLVSLGLCSLIDRGLALRSFKMYFNRISAVLSEELRISVLEVLFDMLMVHEHDFLQRQGETPQVITDHLIARLSEENAPKVKALLAIGISKLVLCGMISDVKAVKKLIVTYLSPDTTGNQELRQCLTFFFPVYCYSSSANQLRIREIFLETFVELNNLRRHLDEDDEMISAAQVAALFVDWTDPLKLSQVANAKDKGNALPTDESTQLDLSSDILKCLLDKKSSLDKEDKRVLTQMLNKLHVPDTIDDDKVRTLKLLIHGVQSRRPLRDAISNNALRKFDTTISKKFEKQLEGFSEEEYRKLADLKELFEFLDDIIPEDDDDYEVDLSKKRGKKRRSESVITTSAESSRYDSPARGEKSNAKRRRIFSPPVNDEGTPPPERPTRTMPKRNAAKKSLEIPVISDDGEDDTRRRPKPRRARRKDVAEEPEDDISHLLDSQQVSVATSSSTSAALPHDSILDDTEEEEVEVNESLLIDD